MNFKKGRVPISLIMLIGLIVAFFLFAMFVAITGFEPEQQETKTWEQMTQSEREQVYKDVYKIQYNAQMNSGHPTLFPKNYVRE